MKLYLASFMEPANFGKGEVISITHGSKPKGIDVRSIYTPLTPPSSLIEKYNKMRDNEDPEKAGGMFRDSYTEQLRNFVKDVISTANAEGKTIQELLPFKDGDTLCSWERAAYTNYRKMLAPFLVELGYEVVLH